MKRVPRRGRRVWAYLDGSRRTCCAIWGRPKPFGRWDTWALERRCRAFEIGCFRLLPDIGDSRDRDGLPTREAQLALDVARLVTGDVVYAFYNRESHAVKIGRTADLLRRWTKLEHESGQTRQLLSVWRSPSGTRDLERQLHQRWIEHRTFGEWFAADPILEDLRQAVTS